MSDRKAVNKYYPPDWTPEQGSINKYVGQHPLRDRARKLDQGILIVRFEIPYNIWCGGCGKMIGTGTRYNAEKKKVGNYYSTPILSFRMKCHLCPQWIEIRTDPKNTAYVVTEGAKQKCETWDPREVGAFNIHSEDTREKLQNPLFRAEHEHDEAALGKRLRPRLQQLAHDQRVFRDSFSLDKKLRDRFRQQRQKMESQADEREQVRARLNVNVQVLPPSESDSTLAQAEDFATRQMVRVRQQKRANLKQGSILPGVETLATKQKRRTAALMFKAKGLSVAPQSGGGHQTTITRVAAAVRIKLRSDNSQNDIPSPTVLAASEAGDGTGAPGLKLGYEDSSSDDEA